ncbi:hypothetical protein [Niallia sp. FSL R7-0271]|uniref:hypothetical protein n=1 Tax=Niallia sp. FSL R7-0271 TaxID=2921678 RepID=UPI0030F4CF84
MRKFFVGVFVLLVSFIIADRTFASENDIQLEDLTTQGEIIYQDEEITVRDFGNDPDIANLIKEEPNSVTANTNNTGIGIQAVGPGGSANVTAATNGRTIYYTVRPATLWPYHFSGVIKLRYYSGFKRDATIGGMGAAGSSVSGAVSMNKNNGGYATLSGKAYSLDGDEYKVLPGVGVAY